MLLQPTGDAAGDPIEKLFSLLASYRPTLGETACACAPAGLAFARDASDPMARARMAATFQRRTDAVLASLLEAEGRLPDALDRGSLAQFVSASLHGAAMQAHALRDPSCFDATLQELRNYIDLLLYGRTRLAFPVRQALAAMAKIPQH